MFSNSGLHFELIFAITNYIFACMEYYIIESKILSILGYTFFLVLLTALYLLQGFIPDQSHSEQSSDLQTICEYFRSDHLK